MNRIKSMMAASIAALSLGGCDAATQIAGDAAQGEMRNAIEAQCRQMAEGAGIVANRVTEVCACSAETLLADGTITFDEVNPAAVEETVNSCARRTGVAAAVPAQTAEETGG